MEPFVMFEGRQLSTLTEKGKVAWEWETKNRIPGFRPEDHQYPKMLYKAQKRHDGKVVCLDTVPPPSPLLTAEQYDRQCQIVENFNRTCIRTVQDEAEEKRAFAEDWRVSPKDALEVHEKWERMMGDEAARLAHADRNLSEKARAEKQAFEDSTPEHVAVVPEARTVKIDKRTKAYKNTQAA